MYTRYFVYIYKIYDYILVYILFFLYMSKTVIHCQQSTQKPLTNDPRMEERPRINVHTVHVRLRTVTERMNVSRKHQARGILEINLGPASQFLCRYPLMIPNDAAIGSSEATLNALLPNTTVM